MQEASLAQDMLAVGSWRQSLPAHFLGSLGLAEALQPPLLLSWDFAGSKHISETPHMHWDS